MTARVFKHQTIDISVTEVFNTIRTLFPLFILATEAPKHRETYRYIKIAFSTALRLERICE
jgi:hypothetical protein